MSHAAAFSSRLFIYWLIGIAFLLSGCGGGGGGDTSPPAVPPPAVPGNPGLGANISAPSTAISFGKVKLDGTLSSNSNGQIANYQWRQTSGPTVTVVQGTDGTASFIAPESAGIIAITLTVSDGGGATAAATSEVTIVAANAAQSNVAIISARLASPLSDGGHTDFSESVDPPLVDTAMLALVALSGPVDENVQFKLVSDGGDELGVLDLKAVSNLAVQPTTFVGRLKIPSQRFKIRAAGSSRRGQQFDLVSTAFTPSRLSIQFEPSVVSGAAGTSQFVRLNITNNGPTSEFTIHVIDPASAVGQPADSVQTIQTDATVSIDLQTTVPDMAKPYETVIAEVNGSQDASSGQLLIWEKAGL